MELGLGAKDAAFRDEVRRFLDEKLTPELRETGKLMTSVYADYETTMTWHKALFEKGWVAPAWPVEYGGCDWSVTQHYIFSSELAAAGAPSLSPMGLGMCGPVLIGYGTQAQKDYYLPRILQRRGFLVSGLFGAGLGFGPCEPANERRRGRRRLHLQRPENLDDACELRQPHFQSGAHLEGRHSPARHHLHPDRHGHTRRQGRTAGDAVGRAHPEPDFLHRCPRAEKECRRQGRRRLDGGEISDAVRTRRPRLCARPAQPPRPHPSHGRKRTRRRRHTADRRYELRGEARRCCRRNHWRSNIPNTASCRR